MCGQAVFPRRGCAGRLGFILAFLSTVSVPMISSPVTASVLRVPLDYPDITSASAAAEPGDSVLVWRNPSGGDWVYQQISLKQGVTLRGMDWGTAWGIEESYLELVDWPAGVEDTTRVERLVIGVSPYQSIEVYTPFSRIDSCDIGTVDPPGWPGIAMWEGGSITRNHIGYGQGLGINLRQGVLVVAWSVIECFMPCQILNEGASQAAYVEIRNNTVVSGEWAIWLRPDSMMEVVSNIYHGGMLACWTEGNVDIHHNDFYDCNVFTCSLGTGNISEYPLYCSIPGHPWLLHADSPCAGTGENGANMGALGVGCGTAGLGCDLEAAASPSVVRLSPNPARNGSSISFGLGRSGTIVLEVYDANGRLVDHRRVRREAGKQMLQVDTKDLRSGMYYYELKVGEDRHTGKLVVVK